MIPAVAIVFFKPNANDLLISLKNISKFSVALAVWNSDPLDLEILAKEKNIDLNGTKIKSIVNNKNLGIGGGLNIAFRFAYKFGLDYILTLDQDSLVIMSKDKILKYFHYFDNIPKFGCLGFKRIKGKCDEFSNFNENKYKKREDLVNFKKGNLLNYSYMHSGSVYCVKSLINLGGFKQEYFIEFTDVEYTLRLNKKKYNLLYIDDPLIIHDAGILNGEYHNFFSFLMHPLWRSYLQYRNLLITLSQNLFYAPLWSLKSIIIFITIIPFKIWINHKSLLKLFLVIFCGTVDGIISVFLKRISLKTYNLILEKLLKFKIPFI